MKNTRSSYPLILLFCIAVLTNERSVYAETIVSNLEGPNLGFWGVNDTFWSAVQFTTDSEDYRVKNVVLFADFNRNRLIRGSEDDILVRILNDNAGLPGSQIGSNLSVPSISSLDLQYHTFASDGSISLQADSNYWLMLGVNLDPETDPNSNPRYRTTTNVGAGPGTMQLGIYTSEDQGGIWSILQPDVAMNRTLIFEVNAVPEPISLALAGLALGWMLSLRTSWH